LAAKIGAAPYIRVRVRETNVERPVALSSRNRSSSLRLTTAATGPLRFRRHTIYLRPFE